MSRVLFEQKIQVRSAILVRTEQVLHDLKLLAKSRICDRLLLFGVLCEKVHSIDFFCLMFNDSPVRTE